MKVYLPSNSKAWISLDPLKLIIQNEKDEIGALKDCITGWVFDEPVTEEAIKKLPREDIIYLYKKIAPIENIVSDQEYKDLVLWFDTDGNVGSVNPEYLCYLYRKKMGLTYKELMETPRVVMLRDLRYMVIEKEVEQIKNNNKTKE